MSDPSSAASPNDLELAVAIRAGDSAAWNTFVQRYSPLILSATVSWCEVGCRIPRSQYDCVLRKIRGNMPEGAQSKDHCREGVALYEFTCKALRERLGDYQGVASLGAFVRLALREIRQEYLWAHQGRLTMPAVLDSLEPEAKAVYRLSCREASREQIAKRTGLTPEAVFDAEREIRAKLQEEGHEWWSVDGWNAASTNPTGLIFPLPDCPRSEAVAALAERRLDAAAQAEVTAHVAMCRTCAGRLEFLQEAEALGGIAPPVLPPAWVNKDVLEMGDAPEAATVGPGTMEKILSQPEWLTGLALGAVTTALILLVVIPRQEYAKSVRDPGDVLLAQAAQPLSPAAAAQLDSARRHLSKGQADAALQDLNSLLATRPEAQEARWLLANTYDRLGDQERAARHYKLFVDTDKRTRDVRDERVRLAEGRLGHWSEMP